MEIRERNYSLDFLKGIAAIFVVFIHIQFPEKVGQYIAEIGAFAVPVFFMVSGYFNATASRKKTKSSIEHILGLILITYILNVLRIYVSNEFSIIESMKYMKQTVFNVKHLVLWIALNVTSISGVAWFLFALLYCYIGRYLFYRISSGKKIYGLIVVGFTAGIIVKILFPILGIGFSAVNNVWCKGIPFFLLGRLIREKRDVLYQIKNWRMFACAGSGFLLISVDYIKKNGFGYIGIILLSSALFALAILYPQLSVLQANKVCQYITKIGTKYSFFFYIGHPLVMHLYDSVITSTGIMQWIRPLNVLFITVLSAEIYYYIKDKVGNGRGKCECR